MTRAIPISALAALAGLLAAQPAAKAPEISVVSIKPSDPGTNSQGNRFPPGRFTVTGYSLISLIKSAYSVKEYQILDAPGWMRSERWNLEGELTQPVSMFSYPQLLQPVLADRYHLKIRRETRTMPIYSLVVAKGGAKLKKSDPEAPGGVRYGNQIIGRKYDIRMLAPNLTGELNMPVVDNTGLTGIYDIDLKWAPDPSRPDFGDVHNPADLPAPDPNRPEIFTAIKEQLGLELKAEKGPVDVIVIDHIERPTPN
jgi:uncharacterized protein (TIGR03435 family)